MTRKEKFTHIINYFKKLMPEVKSELKYSNPYELVVAVILSSQCTDKRVNQITPHFFKKFPNFLSLAKASYKDIYELIKSCSYPNNKTRYLINVAKIIIEKYNGLLPDEVDELMKLPGLGRKSANVIASILFNKPVIAVDTHVHRVSNRIGLTKNAKTPIETEKQLYKYVTPELRPSMHHWLVLHGRYICKAKNPYCKECGINKYCDFFNSNYMK